MRAEKAVPTEEFVSRRIKFAGQEPTELLDLEAVNKLLAKGASLILNAADECDPALRSLCRSLSEVFASHVAANAYASFGNEPAFPVHWDDHEVLVIQIEGRKHWRVFEPSRPQPLGNDVESNIEPSDRQIWEGVIGPGDKLYIPRGRWHSVTLA